MPQCNTTIHPTTLPRVSLIATVYIQLSTRLQYQECHSLPKCTNNYPPSHSTKSVSHYHSVIQLSIILQYQKCISLPQCTNNYPSSYSTKSVFHSVRDASGRGENIFAYITFFILQEKHYGKYKTVKCRYLSICRLIGLTFLKWLQWACCCLTMVGFAPLSNH